MIQINKEVITTELLCDYPQVTLEKPRENSDVNPRPIFSFLQFRLYTSIKINCKITNLYRINWYAYEMIAITNSIFDDSQQSNAKDDAEYVTLPQSASKFSSRFHKFRPIPNLSYTYQSEDITFMPRSLKIGLHLICVNVAMLNVVGLNSTDCIYIDIVLPPIVAGINYGLRRSIRHGKVVVMDAISASYDPDTQTIADVQNPSYEPQTSNLIFKMSCPFLVESDSADQVSLEEKKLMFGEETSK